MEIERKWRLKGLPQITTAGGKKITHARIRQGYVCNVCVGRGELRIRDKDGKYYLTVKGDGTISREEWETEIPPWVFEQLWLNCRDCTLEKMRYFVPYGEFTLEIDSYFGPLSELTTLEIEFASEEQARQFDVTAIAADAVDVTDDKRYKNKSLAMYGLPE